MGDLTDTLTEDGTDADRDGGIVEFGVHPSWRWAGGEFEPPNPEAYPPDSIYAARDPFPPRSPFRGPVGRATRGGRWKERFEERSTEPFAESVAIANARTGEDGDDLVLTDIPYGTDWDAVVEDPDAGDVDPERIAEFVEGRDAVVLRGGWFMDCERRFAANLAEATDEDQTVVVDLGHSFVSDGARDESTASLSSAGHRRLWEEMKGTPNPSPSGTEEAVAAFEESLGDAADQFVFVEGLAEAVERGVLDDVDGLDAGDERPSRSDGVDPA